MEFCIRNIPKARITTTGPLALTKATAPCLPAPNTLIYGRYPSALGRIPVRSFGSITRADKLQDITSCLFGMIVVKRRGLTRPDGGPKDVDHKFMSMYIAINENESSYLEENIRDHTTDPKGVDRTQISLITPSGMAGTIAGTGFVDTNIKWSINGYIFGNMPSMTMEVGDHVRVLNRRYDGD
jgi:hypothetical protein